MKPALQGVFRRAGSFIVAAMVETIIAAFRRVFSWALPALALCGAAAAGEGAAATGEYRNLFQEWDAAIDAAAVDAKLETYWASLFEGGEDARVYYPAASNENGPTAYILDVGHKDIRTEGVSYGMMIAVQMNRKEAFDAIWNWADAHMKYKDGPRKGYFRWRCVPEGCLNDAVPASDGEEYFATALFFAAHRWGNGEGIYDYEREANAILDAMLHKEDMNGGIVDGVVNMFDRKRKQVVFVARGRSAEFTDPSYHLPAFYELWARWATGWNGRREEDRRFWREAAETSRTFFDLAADSETGLTPDYAEFNGAPKPLRGHGDFRYDAHRTAMNWAVDYAWWGKDDNAPARSNRLQAFFEAQGMETYVNQYTIKGKPLSDGRSASLIACNGAASLAATDSRAKKFVAALWALEPPTGEWRYYNGLLQFMATMHAGGRFQVY